jgi:hypothetical protein
MKRVAISLTAAALAIAAGTTASARDLRMLAMLLFAHPPHERFDAITPPLPPDYAKPASWAALPDKKDASDVAPAGVAMIDPARAPADVFFVHPTSFFSNSHWNADIMDVKTNARTDKGSIRNQASVFNGCCRVYAPRYRQMTFSGFLKHSKSSAEALDLAYSDVKRAFEYYLAHDNDGRPFIIASHSQGSRLATRLVKEMIDGTPLMKRFVAAYIVGNWLDDDYFRSLKTIEPCSRADDTGCVLTWSTLAEDADAQRQRDGFAKRSGLPESHAHHHFVCTNPLTWTTATTLAPATRDIGGWVYGRGAAPRPPDPHLVSMRCDDGALFVSRPHDSIYRARLLPGGNYHNYDYQLAYMNIRKNARVRVKAFIARRGDEPNPPSP